MRAGVVDTRLEAIAGPVHYAWGEQAPDDIPETVAVPVTIAAVITATETSGGRYIIDSPSRNGRRAYMWLTGTWGEAPTGWQTGLLGERHYSLPLGERLVLIGRIGNGIPPDTFVRNDLVSTPEHGTLHDLIIWSRELTVAEQARVRAHLATTHQAL